MMYLPLYKVADTPFRIQGDGIWRLQEPEQRKAELRPQANILTADGFRAWVRPLIG